MSTPTERLEFSGDLIMNARLYVYRTVPWKYSAGGAYPSTRSPRRLAGENFADDDDDDDGAATRTRVLGARSML